MTKKNITIDKKRLSREAIAVAVDGKTLPIEINSSIILTYGNEPVMMNCIGISVDSDRKAQYLLETYSDNFERSSEWFSQSQILNMIEKCDLKKKIAGFKTE